MPKFESKRERSISEIKQTSVYVETKCAIRNWTKEDIEGYIIQLSHSYQIAEARLEACKDELRKRKENETKQSDSNS